MVGRCEGMVPSQTCWPGPAQLLLRHCQDSTPVLVPQIIVFDLEYGQPAASTPLPGSRVSLDYLLACYGHAGTRLRY